MKKTLLTFICVFALNLCFAQNVNRTAHRGGSTVTGQMVGINSKSYYIEISTLYNKCCNDKAYVVGIGDAGEELFRTLVCSVPYLQRPRIAISADKGIFACAGTKFKGCDVGGKWSTVCKLDTLGNITWSVNLSVEIDHLVALPDNGVGIFIADDFRRYSQSGNLVSSTLLKAGSPSAVCALSSGNLLLSYQGTTGPGLRVINLKDSVISDIAFPSFLQILKEGNDGNIYGINNGFMMKISLTSGLLLHSNGKLPANMLVTDLQIRNDSLFTLTQGGPGNLNFLIMDTAFHILHQKTSNISSVASTGLFVGKNNRLNVNTTGSSGYFYGGFFQTNLMGNLNANDDIGVTSLIVHDSSSAYSGGQFRSVTLSADVVVKNFGTDTVKQFFLNHYTTVTGITFCLLGLNKQFTASIPPNGTVVVNTGTFMGKPLGYFVTDNYNYDLCFVATLPDNRHDVNTLNDGVCRTVVVVPVGVKEVQADNAFGIYPNPVKGKLNISSIEEIKTAEVYDLNGRLVQKIETSAGAVREVIINLPDGVYILKVKTKSGVRNHKFCFIN